MSEDADLNEWRVTRREPEQDRHYGRDAFEIDRDRVLYSGHFLRLAEVTQTVSPIHGYVFHNRLSHSLKVGHVARRISEHLLRNAGHDPVAAAAIEAGKGLDPTVAELAGFAHDLGHPPFGHVAEKVLGRLAREELTIDGFEGNAQTLRIINSLAAGDVAVLNRKKGALGLNLTRASVNAICKYPWVCKSPDSPKSEEKFGCYQTENDVLTWARAGLDAGVRTLEASIMDWADDVTFSIHDLLDFYSAGQIPLHLYTTRSDETKRSSEFAIFMDYIVDTPKKREHFAQLVDELRATSAELGTGQLKDILGHFLAEGIYDSFAVLGSRYTGSPEQRDAIAASTSDGIRRCIFAVSLDVSRAVAKPDGVFQVDPAARLFIELLKQFTWHYVIDGFALAADQLGHREAVEKTFQALYACAREPQKAFVFPAHIRRNWGEKLGEKDKREIVDYVASMSEPELMRFYKQITARNSY